MLILLGYEAIFVEGSQAKSSAKLDVSWLDAICRALVPAKALKAKASGQARTASAKSFGGA